MHGYELAEGARRVGVSAEELLRLIEPGIVRHDLDQGVEPLGDLAVLLTSRGQEHEPGPDDVAIRC